ncbi:MAG TPA: hypothetical protein VIZ43_29065 [Trebonia sp.]
MQQRHRGEQARAGPPRGRAHPHGESASRGPAASSLFGSVDLGSAAALLAGALPVIVILRRRRPRIPDRLYSRSYLALLALVTIAMVIASLRRG